MSRDAAMTYGLDQFFAPLILENEAIVRTFPVIMFNNRAIWAEVELFIFFKLRFGWHPCEVDFWIYKGLQETTGKILYHHEFFHGCSRMMQNLRLAGLFDELPDFRRYQNMGNDDLKKARFEVMMYHRFEDEYAFHSYALDEDVMDVIGQSPPLDDECVRRLNERYHDLVDGLENKYCAARGISLKSEGNAELSIPALFDANDPATSDIWNGRGSYPGLRGYSVPSLPHLSRGISASSRLKTGGTPIDRAGSPESDTPTKKSRGHIPPKLLTADLESQPERYAASVSRVSTILRPIAPNTRAPGTRDAKYWKAKKLEMFVLPTVKTGGSRTAELVERDVSEL